jgi:hypothetical protein
MVFAVAMLFTAMHGTGPDTVNTICPEDPAIGPTDRRQSPAECRPVIVVD